MFAITCDHFSEICVTLDCTLNNNLWSYEAATFDYSEQTFYACLLWFVFILPCNFN